MYKAKVTLTRSGDYDFSPDVDKKIPIEVTKDLGKDRKMRMGLWITTKDFKQLRKEKKSLNNFEIEGWNEDKFAFGGDL